MSRKLAALPDLTPERGQYDDFDCWFEDEWELEQIRCDDSVKNEFAGTGMDAWLESEDHDDRREARRELERIWEKHEAAYRRECWLSWLAGMDDPAKYLNKKDRLILDLTRRLAESEASAAELYQQTQRDEAGRACGEVPFCGVCGGQLFCRCGDKKR